MTVPDARATRNSVAGKQRTEVLPEEPTSPPPLKWGGLRRVLPIRQAAERGWKVPDEIRTDALRRIAELLESPGLTPRDLASIVRTLAVLDRTDMLEEKLTLDRAKWAAGQPKETVETAADLARQLLDAARGHEESGP